MALTKAQSIMIIGTTTNDSAPAGCIGEYSTSNPGGTVAPAASGVAKTVTSFSLTAGDWDVWGTANWVVGNSTGGTQLQAGISTTTNAYDATNSGGYAVYPTNGTANYLPTGVRRISLSGTTTVYLVATSAYSVVGTAVWGTDSIIQARRVR